MSEEIRPVTPKRWRDLERLFGPKGAYSNCWCMYWRWRRRDFREATPAARKAALRAWVRSGTEPGLLAYRRGEPVAWCALAPRDEYAALGASPTLKPVGDTARVWSITCYYVPKEHRRTGLMTALPLAYTATPRSRALRWSGSAPRASTREAGRFSTQRVSGISLWFGNASKALR